jgi:predicted MFS family arabinose efflux permease
MIAAGLLVFVSCHIFIISFTARLVFGLGAGIMSSIMWWLAYESIDKKFYIPMIIVLTASHPMAVAAGVPLVMYASKYVGCPLAFGLSGVLIVLFSLLLSRSMPDDKNGKNKFTLKNIFRSNGKNCYKLVSFSSISMSLIVIV